MNSDIPLSETSPATQAPVTDGTRELEPPAPAAAPSADPGPTDVAPPVREAASSPAPAGSDSGGAAIGAPRDEARTDADGSAENETSRRSRQRRRGRGKGAGEGEASEAGAAPDGAAAPMPSPAAPVEADPVLIAERFGEVVSGAYDAEPPEPDDEASLEQSTKRVLRPEPEAPKLHKLLAQSGIGSRRDMEQWIEDGKVTVNDEVAHIGMRVAQGDRIAVDGKPVRLRFLAGPPRVLAYHKPAGEVVTFNDPEGRPTVFRRLPRLPHGKWQSVGRLDINTEGLLLFTNAGELANQLMHPRFGIEREYAVRVLGSLDDAQRQRLLEGVEIEGQTASFRSIEDGGGEGANRWYRVVITEGRNREVRKLFGAVELAVSRLIRIRYGCVVLPRGLKRGVWVELDDADVRTIRQVVGRGRPQGDAPPARTQGERPADAGPRGDRGMQNGKRGRGGKGNGPRGPNERGPRPDQAPRAASPVDGAREPRPRDRDADGAPGEDFTRIPNPLEQTFDRRFAKGGPRGPNHGFGSAAPRDPDYDGPPGSIPNPLEQTFDKRFVKGSQRINAGFGRPTEEPGPGGPPGGKKGGPKQPDPMQTAVGYIGADAFFSRPGGKRGGRPGGGGGGGGSGGGGGGGGGRGRR